MSQPMGIERAKDQGRLICWLFRVLGILVFTVSIYAFQGAIRNAMARNSVQAGEDYVVGVMLLMGAIVIFLYTRRVWGRAEKRGAAKTSTFVFLFLLSSSAAITSFFLKVLIVGFVVALVGLTSLLIIFERLFGAPRS